MNLSKSNLSAIKTQPGVSLPAASVLELPEKVLQFGTGVLLRGLPDYFIDMANKQNVFNGRVVVVKSTSSGGTDAFDTQNGLYTICVRGIDGAQRVDEQVVNASISRVLAAKEHWNEILECASNPQMQIIISNTTEVGIALVEEDKVTAQPPVSFPGKLLAFLLKRYEVFAGSKESGMVIIPTELIVDNGKKLKSIVNELAKLNNLSESFIEWLNTANDFCSSLVDRIVPGKLSAEDKAATEAKLGFTDDLMIMSEVYRLWAIETDSERTKEILSFSKVDEGVVLAPSIDVFRELKLRLLNGTHTFSCGIAFLSGFATVKQAMEDKIFSSYISTLMLDEIAPAITYERLSLQEAHPFAYKVMDRFRNPYIEHQWISITMQYTSKMKMRNVPIILEHFEKFGVVPQYMSLGFAAYLLFMKTQKNNEGKYITVQHGKEYMVNDDVAGQLYEVWQSQQTADKVVDVVLKDGSLWGTNLAVLPGFAEAVKGYLVSFQDKGVAYTLQQFQLNKTEV